MGLDFREVTLKDREWIDPLLKLGGRGALEYNFTTTFVWRCSFKFRIARMDDYFLLRCDFKSPCYLFPSGKGPLDPVVRALQADAQEAGVPLKFNTVLSDGKAKLEELYPGKFTFEDYRDGADYVYDTQMLATLKGRKFASKRNHIHRFVENHPDWRYEPLTQENLEEARLMNKEWCIQNGCADNLSLGDEYCAVESAIRHFDELKLDGGLLRAGGKVLAFSIGDPLNDDTYLVHFEKAFASDQGAYPMINQQFVRHNCMDYPYVNREEDAGIQGLRRAKMSYKPLLLVKKYAATLKEPL